MWPVDFSSCVTGGVVDIQGVCKSTVAKGEDEFPDGVLRITDCHDSVIYALAPLQYASINCCSDCTVVVGAVGRMLKVERCERLQLIAGCARICISSCHESVFYLGVNQPPLLLGDNRFVQVLLCCNPRSGSSHHSPKKTQTRPHLPETDWQCTSIRSESFVCFTVVTSQAVARFPAKLQPH